jgi:hypothetical protein
LEAQIERKGVTEMAILKERLGYGALGVVLTLAILYPWLKETRREQQWGLLLTPEDVKGACGRPQSDDGYTLTYIIGDRYMALNFFGANHRMFLQKVTFHAVPQGVPSGGIYVVTRDQITEHFRKGYLPACIEQAVQ